VSPCLSRTHSEVLNQLLPCRNEMDAVSHPILLQLCPFTIFPLSLIPFYNPVGVPGGWKSVCKGNTLSLFLSLSWLLKREIIANCIVSRGTGLIWDRFRYGERQRQTDLSPNRKLYIFTDLTGRPYEVVGYSIWLT